MVNRPMTPRFLIFSVFIIMIGVIGISSFASSVNIVRTTFQADSGELIYVYFVITSGQGSTSPSTNTALSQPSGSGSYQVSRGSSAYLWSPQFSTSSTLSQGSWVLDLWASCTTSSTISVSIYTTTSSGTIQSTILGSSTTGVIPTTMTQVVSSFSGSSGMIPASGYVEVILTVSNTPRHCVIYWGNGQETNFQVPYSVLST